MEKLKGKRLLLLGGRFLDGRAGAIRGGNGSEVDSHGEESPDETF